MDNVTHSLIGALIAKTAIRVRRRRKEQGGATAAQESSAEPTPLERGIFWSAVLSSNAPDLDFLPSALGWSSQLEYLLDHRGYTHTLVMAPAMAIASMIAGAVFGFRGFEGFKKLKEPAVLKALGLTALVGALLHIGADSWNEYGVHPFWPFSNRWYYGDFIFIVEPLIWLALLPVIYFEARTRRARAVPVALAFSMLMLVFSGKFMELSVAIGIAAFGALVLLAQKRWRGLSVAWTALLAVLVAFKGASILAESRAREAIAASRPSERIVQLAVAPAPGNPLCWRVISAGVEGEEYVARIGGISLIGGAFDVLDCPMRLRGPRFAPLGPSIVPETPALGWIGEFRRPVAQMKRLAAENCGFASLLKFARIPFWFSLHEGQTTAGDLRYDRGPGRGSFAVMTVDDSMGRDAQGRCAQWPWIEPVAELLAK